MNREYEMNQKNGTILGNLKLLVWSFLMMPFMGIEMTLFAQDEDTRATGIILLAAAMIILLFLGLVVAAV